MTDAENFETMSADTSLTPTHGRMSSIQCCCGSLDCVYLKHNSTVLETVETQLSTAGRMGKALLERHEAYMADAERDRKELTSRIEQLEMNNKELEAQNAKTIEENRNLLDQLEALNTSVTDSEARIKSLEATLLSSQQTIRRLEADTARAESLERQIAHLEQEQMELHTNLTASQEEARSAISRWRRAERGINDLQEQLERIERESKEEHERHVEMMGRVEKQRAVERELNTAAGRLKGAAAAKSLVVGKEGNNVVSHFVRDLLQDNANLQHGIAELREMLMNSNDEIQALREQLLFHQPMQDGEASASSTLKAELEAVKEATSPSVSQELHIHHHYHVAKQEAKKPKKKRQSLNAGVFVPPPGSFASTPPRALDAPRRFAHLPKDSISAFSNRSSIFSEQPSEFAPSSVPTSPMSSNRNSVFDPTMVDSFPGSPTTSVDPMSPSWRMGHRKQESYYSARSFQSPNTFAPGSPSTPTQARMIIEEEGVEDTPDLVMTTDDSAADDESSSKDADADPSNDEMDIFVHDADRRALRRVVSHESILSLSGGLDIHTLKSRPSQVTLRHLSSATSVTGSSAVVARPTLSREAKRSSALLRERYAASPPASYRAVSGPAGPSTLSKWTGWRLWGGHEASANTAAPAKPKDSDSIKNMPRSPGINQPGAIPGFTEHWINAKKNGPPSKVLPDLIDEDALREGLAE